MQNSLQKKIASTMPPSQLFVLRFVVIAMGFFTWALIIVFRLIALMLPFVAKFLGTYGLQFAIAACIIGLGFVAHEFKKADQLLYGRLEICFGIASASALAFSTLPTEMHPSQWASLVGAAYVIARGRNNVADAKRKPEGSKSPFFSTAGQQQDTEPL